MDAGVLGGGTAAESVLRAMTVLSWASGGVSTNSSALAALSTATPLPRAPRSSTPWSLSELPLRPLVTPAASLPKACAMGGVWPLPLLLPLPLPSIVSPPAPGASCTMPRSAACGAEPRRRRRTLRPAPPPSLAAVLSLDELGAVVATAASASAAATASPRPPGSPFVAQLPLAVLLSSTASAGADAAALFSVESVAAVDADGVGDA